jgi:hypothetical protein
MIGQRFPWEYNMTVLDPGPVNPRLTSFLGGNAGEWRVTSQTTLRGEPIDAVTRVAMVSGSPASTTEAAWVFQGAATHDRYTTRPEKTALVAVQAPIGRPQATRAVFTLLRKNAEWWGLTQDERRAILEEQSHHIAIGLRYLPAIARRLMHCRDFAANSPFDFLGFLDFAPEDEPAYDEMVALLRATPEWAFYDREIDIRLTRDR